MILCIFVISVVVSLFSSLILLSPLFLVSNGLLIVLTFSKKPMLHFIDFFLKERSIYLLTWKVEWQSRNKIEQEQDRTRVRETCLPSAGSFSKWIQNPRLGHCETRSFIRVSYMLTWYRVLGHLLLPSHAHLKVAQSVGIPPWMCSILSELWSQTGLGMLSIWVGEGGWIRIRATRTSAETLIWDARLLNGDLDWSFIYVFSFSFIFASIYYFLLLTLKLVYWVLAFLGHWDALLDYLVFLYVFWIKCLLQ